MNSASMISSLYDLKLYKRAARIKIKSFQVIRNSFKLFLFLNTIDSTSIRVSICIGRIQWELGIICRIQWELYAAKSPKSYNMITVTIWLTCIMNIQKLQHLRLQKLKKTLSVLLLNLTILANKTRKFRRLCLSLTLRIASVNDYKLFHSIYELSS